MQAHEKDIYVKAARKEGYRSRAALKLLEILKKGSIISKGNVVVDLGAAPGGWSQVLAQKVGANGRVIAVDCLPMQPLAEVIFIQGDFTEPMVLSELAAKLSDGVAHVVVSDMAPNLSGNRTVDQAKAMYLAECARDFALSHLLVGGHFLVKVFQGEGFETYIAELKAHFKKVVVRKPKSSKPESREVYLLSTGYTI